MFKSQKFYYALGAAPLYIIVVALASAIGGMTVGVISSLAVALAVYIGGLRIGKAKDPFVRFPVLAMTLIVPTALSTSIVISSINKAIGDVGFEKSQEVAQSMPMWLMLVYGLLIAPIAEELITRGVIYRLLQQWTAIAYVASIGIFAVIHGNITQGILASVVGLFAIAAYRSTGSIFFPIAVHIISNATTLTAPYILQGIPLNLPVTTMAAIVMIVSTTIVTVRYASVQPLAGRSLTQAAEQPLAGS